MSDFDPRTSTGIPTEPVGSLPRPARLQEAYAGYDEGKVSREDLETEQESAIRDSIDFTEGRLATRNDPRNPWTAAACCRISSS
jgi:hypothetical protein